jgi:hypothetical protein
MRAAISRNPIKVALILAATLALAACANDAGRLAKVDNSNGSAAAISGFH